LLENVEDATKLRGLNLKNIGIIEHFLKLNKNDRRKIQKVDIKIDDNLLDLTA
jgi:hypothetical protein